MELKHKRIVITGGASGLGRALVERLQETNELIVIARPSERLDRLRKDRPQIAIFEADLSDERQVEAAADAIARRHDLIDVLINNAAVQHIAHLNAPAFRPETIAAEVAVNFTAPCLLSAKLLPQLAAAPQALIVNVNSGLGLVPKTSSAVYCATKGGLNIFSLALANQLEGTNIKVAQAFLPLIDTAMTKGRGTGKLSARDAAARIVSGLERGRREIDIGKVRLLRPMARFLPALARRIMKAA